MYISMQIFLFVFDWKKKTTVWNNMNTMKKEVIYRGAFPLNVEKGKKEVE